MKAGWNPHRLPGDPTAVIAAPPDYNAQLNQLSDGGQAQGAPPRARAGSLAEG